MTILDTQLNARSADFLANAAAMRTLVDDLRAQLDKVAQGGGEAARAKHTARGKLLPRERVQMLLDPGTPFLELAPLAALNMYNNDAPSAGLIAGIGRVSGVDCMVVCNDATVKGGTYYPMTVKKHLRAQEVAATGPAPSTSHAASCCRASVCRCCWTRARPSSNSRRWPRSTCTTTTPPARA